MYLKQLFFLFLGIILLTTARGQIDQNNFWQIVGFQSDMAVLTIKDTKNYNLEASMAGCSWTNEGTYTIEGDFLKLHPTFCTDLCAEGVGNPCETSMGEAICSIVENNGLKKLKIQSVMKKDFSIMLPIFLKENPFADIKKLHLNEGSLFTELDGKWLNENGKDTIQFSQGNSCFQGGVSSSTFKISKTEIPTMIYDSILSLVKGTYITEIHSMLGLAATYEYNIEGDVLTLKFASGKVEKYTRINDDFEDPEIKAQLDALETKTVTAKFLKVVMHDIAATIIFEKADGSKIKFYRCIMQPQQPRLKYDPIDRFTGGVDENLIGKTFNIQYKIAPEGKMDDNSILVKANLIVGMDLVKK